MLKHLIYTPVLLILIGCGSDSTVGARGLVDVADVSGDYSIITSAISAKCSDGSTGTSSALAMTGKIIHDGQKVQFTNDNAGDSTPGITIIETDDLDGVIEDSGKFVMTSTATIQIDGVSGNNTASYHLSGYFNDSGWSGDYVYTVYFQSVNASCEYSTTFSGNKE
jgi:hypothetical protein